MRCSTTVSCQSAATSDIVNRCWSQESDSCKWRYSKCPDLYLLPSWLVSYGGKTIPRWRMAAILKIDKSPYLSEKSSDFHETLYTAADFELDECHVIKNEKVALDRPPSSSERISSFFNVLIAKCLFACALRCCRQCVMCRLRLYTLAQCVVIV